MSPSVGNQFPLEVDFCTADVNGTVPAFELVAEEEDVVETPQLYTK